MSLIKLADHYTAVDPIFISAPTTRCGTTFLQRLMLSGSNSIIFGENLGLQMQTMTELFVGILQEFSERGEVHEKEIQSVLKGNNIEWNPGLLPPQGPYLEAMADMYFALPLKVSAFCREAGRPVWGMKCPGWGYMAIKAMRSLIPRAKFIYVYRNVYDCVASAKARRFVRTADDAGAFAHEWASHMVDMSELHTDNAILFLKYEELITQPDEHISALSAFTGAEGLSRDVFDVKVNTFAGSESDGHNAAQYIPPAKLTKAEREAIKASAGHVLFHLYPQAFAA